MSDNDERDIVHVRDHEFLNAEWSQRVRVEVCPDVRCAYNEFPRCGRHFCIRPSCVFNLVAIEPKITGKENG